MKLIPRDHIVTFRLTKTEYESLKTLCDERSSSISDAARDAVLALAPPSGTTESVEIRLNTLDEKLNQIIALLNSCKQAAGDKSEN